MSKKYPYFKFTSPCGETCYHQKHTLYTPGRRTPRLPDFERDGQACGPGRYHLVKIVDARYAPPNWVLWRARGYTMGGQNNKKASFAQVILRPRPITPRVIARFIRMHGAPNADLRYANLRNANLRNANLRDANLRNANLYNAILYNANLRNAAANSRTLWPEGFDPQAAGVRRV